MTRTYRGQTIYPCESAEQRPGNPSHGGRWAIQSYHVTRFAPLPYADELCPHYRTLAAAREAIDEMGEQGALAQ